MRRSASEKLEIIRIVEGSELGVKRTLEELGINRSTFYEWYRNYLEHGFEGLKPKVPNRKSFWNKIPDQERNKVVEFALEKTDLSPRELAFHITDHQGWFISESSVYRILKERGLITSPAWILMAAADEFKDKTTYVHQQWQTDDAKRVVGVALQKSGLDEQERPRLLTDNGSCYISVEFKKFIEEQDMGHVRGAPYQPQTQGKIERYHRTMKNVVKLENYFFPDDLKANIEAFVNYYNNQRYHESLGNMTPADVYFGRVQQIKSHRHQIKMKTLKERRKINRKLSA